jgi:hypothetical protein
VVDRIKEVMTPIVSFIKVNVIDKFVSLFDKASSVISEKLKPLKRAIANPIIDGINWALEKLELGLNAIVKGINTFFSKFSGLVSLASKVTGDDWGGINLITGSISLGRIPKYQTGGFPEDGLFFANHNELIGGFTNGKTTVANNEQIIAGIERGVRDANAEQNALLREQNALLRQILAKDTGISSRDVFNAVRTESNNYTKRTGQPAFV